MSENPERELTEEEMIEEVHKHLLYQSHFTCDNGPQCHCMCAKLDHFHAMLPNEACGKDITDMEFEEELEVPATSICPCQESHFYKVKLGPNGLQFEETEGEEMDNRKLRLPNHRSY